MAHDDENHTERHNVNGYFADIRPRQDAVIGIGGLDVAFGQIVNLGVRVFHASNIHTEGVIVNGRV